MSDKASEYTIDLTQLNNIIIRKEDKGFVAVLADDGQMEMVRGFGPSPLDALNDLHRNLI